MEKENMVQANRIIPVLQNLLDHITKDNSKEVLPKFRKIINTVGTHSFKSIYANYVGYREFMDLFDRTTYENAAGNATKLYSLLAKLEEQENKEEADPNREHTRDNYNNYNNLFTHPKEVEPSPYRPHNKDNYKNLNPYKKEDKINEDDVPADPAASNQTTTGSYTDLGQAPTGVLAVISAPTSYFISKCPYCSSKNIQGCFCNDCNKVVTNNLMGRVSQLRESIMDVEIDEEEMEDDHYSKYASDDENVNEDDTENISPHDSLDDHEYLKLFFNNKDFEYDTIKDIPDSVLKETKVKSYIEELILVSFLIKETAFVMGKVKDAETVTDLPVTVKAQLIVNLNNITKHLDNIIEDMSEESDLLRFEDSEELIARIVKLTKSEYGVNLEHTNLTSIKKTINKLYSNINSTKLTLVKAYLLGTVSQIDQVTTKMHGDLVTEFPYLALVNKKVTAEMLNKGGYKLKQNFNIISFYNNTKLHSYLAV